MADPQASSSHLVTRGANKGTRLCDERNQEGIKPSEPIATNTILQQDHQDAATTLLFKHSAIIQVNHGSPQQVINIKTMKRVRVL